MPNALELSRHSCFRKVPLEPLQRVASLWVEVHLTPGAVLWTAGEPARDIGLLVDGEVGVEVAGETVARLRAGDLIGEAGVYGGGQRNATVRAISPGRLWLMTDSDLARVRAGIPEVYAALVDQALFQVVQRIRRAGEMITARAPGEMQAPAREKLVGLARMWRALVPGGPSNPCPPLAPLLRRVKGLGNAPPEAVIALSTCFRPQQMSEGEVLVLQAEPGDWAFLIAEGEVDVVRHVHGGKAEKLARIGRGTLVGINALIDAGPRTASCVAVTAGWIFRIDMEHLRAPPIAAVTWWKDTLLINLASQLRSADDSLARLRGQGPLPSLNALSDFSPLEVEVVEEITNEEELQDLETSEVEILHTEDHPFSTAQTEPPADDTDGRPEPPDPFTVAETPDPFTVAETPVVDDRDGQADPFQSATAFRDTSAAVEEDPFHLAEPAPLVTAPERDELVEDTFVPPSDFPVAEEPELVGTTPTLLPSDQPVPESTEPESQS